MPTRDVYLDFAAGAPPWPEALDVFTQTSCTCPGNPSSAHPAGRAAAAALADARARFQSLCGCSSGRLLLTSGGTEANNLVIRGVMARHPHGRLLLAADVHSSAWFARDHFGKRVDVVGLAPDGTLTPDALRRHLSRHTVLCSVTHANNETGVIHDIRALGTTCSTAGVRLHVDGAQVPGHLPLEIDALAADFYTFSAHKFGAPRGVGGMFLRDTLPLPCIEGGDQEQGLRAGTENVAGLAAAVRALECSLALLPTEAGRLRALANQLLDGVRTRHPDVLLNSDLAAGLPGLVSLCFPGTQGSQLVTELGLHGFAVSAGSACHSGAVLPSRIILALGRPPDTALGTIRVSMGRTTRTEDVAAFLQALVEIVDRQKALA